MVRKWLHQLVSLFRRRHLDDELDEEIRAHLEMATEEYLRQGMAPREARLAARRRFGGVDQVKERHREVRGFRWLAHLGQDIRLALRTLLKDRGFAAVTVVTLAVGIGANTAIFSVVDAVLLRPLAYPDAERVITLNFEPASNVSDAGYWHVREKNRSFDDLGAFRSTQLALTGRGEPTQISVGLMTNSAYSVLGIPPLRGRLPSEEEDLPDGPLVTVLGHGLWVARFGSDPNVIGGTIQLDGSTREVVGIMPPDFAFPSREIDLWIPLQLDHESRNFLNRHLVIGRLRDGATVESATTDAESLIQRLGEAGYGPESLSRFTGRATLRTLKESIVGDSRELLLIVLGAMSFVLLIAGANVANLFFVRADGRVRQTAVRTALGATRRRLIQHVLTESVLLALIGGLGGLALAYTGIRVLVAIGPASIPRLGGVGISATVFWYTTGVSVLSGLLFGILPTARTGSAKLRGALTDGGRGSTVGRDRLRLRALLVGSEVALAVVLLIGSGLMVRSLQHLRSIDPGFDPGGVVTFDLPLPATRYSDAVARTQFFDQLLERVRALPGVEAAGATTDLPLRPSAAYGFRIEEFPTGPDESSPVFTTRWVTPGYLETMRIPIVSGRTVEPMDHQERLGKLFISASIKEQYWPNTSTLGKRLGPGGFFGEVAGVVGDVRVYGLDAPAAQTVYLPLDWPRPPGGQLAMSVAVRGTGNPSDLVPQLRREVGALDPSLPLSNIDTMDEVVGDSVSRRSFTMLLLVLAAFVAVFLGSVGIYGVLSYVVSQRTSELGVRMALGADSADIRSLVLGRGMTWTVIGLAVGLGSAALMSRMLTSLLFETSPFDPLTFVAGPIVFLAVAAVACVVPARKAAGIDPTEALRSD